MNVDRILVPTDGSEQARKAMEVALTMADQFDSESIHALFVVDSALYSEPALSFTELLTDDVQAAADELMDDFRGRADALGVTIETDVAHGRPKTAIVDRAEELGSDLIVIGSRSDEFESGESPLCKYVARNASCNVLVV